MLSRSWPQQPEDEPSGAQRSARKFRLKTRDAGDRAAQSPAKLGGPEHRKQKSALRFPRCQCGLGGGRIILDAIDRLPAEVGGFGDRDDVGTLAEHVLHHGKLVAVIAWLPPAVALATRPGVRDAGPLRLRRLGLRLSGGGHEADQRVAHRHLHRVCRSVVALLVRGTFRT